MSDLNLVIQFCSLCSGSPNPWTPAGGLLPESALESSVSGGSLPESALESSVSGGSLPESALESSVSRGLLKAERSM